MITLPSKRDQDAVNDLVAEASLTGRGYEAGLGFFIGGQNVTPRLKEAEWGQTETPITLTATISGYLRRHMQTENTLLAVELAGAFIPQVNGVKTVSRPGEDAFTTELISSSPGALLNSEDAITLDRYTEYPNHRPHQVVWDIARRLPYDQNLIDIQELPGVSVNFSGTGTEPGFLAEERTGDVLSRLSGIQSIGYSYRDTAFRGLVAEIPQPLGRIGGSASGSASTRNLGDMGMKTYHARRLPDWNQSRPATPEALYRDVRVYCTSESGYLQWEYFEEVPYVGNVPLPHKGRTLHIAYNDYSADGYANGKLYAESIATELARMTSVGEMLLPCFDPLYERGDRYRVAEDLKDDEGHLEILWSMRTEAYKHGYNTQLGQGTNSATSGVLGTLLTYSATILEENVVRPPALIVPGTSPGIFPSYPQTNTDTYGTYGIDGDDVYFMDDVDWIAVNAEEIIVYENETVAIDPANGDLVVSQ